MYRAFFSADEVLAMHHVNKTVNLISQFGCRFHLYILSLHKCHGHNTGIQFDVSCNGAASMGVKLFEACGLLGNCKSNMIFEFIFLLIPSKLPIPSPPPPLVKKSVKKSKFLKIIFKKRYPRAHAMFWRKRACRKKRKKKLMLDLYPDSHERLHSNCKPLHKT